MANHGRNPRTGRFISRRVQNLQQLAGLPDDEWATDTEALIILEAGVAKAIQDGWRPPAAPGRGIWPDDPRRTDENDWGTPEPPEDLPPDHDPWIDALKADQ